MSTSVSACSGELSGEALQPARGALRHGVILELHERLAADARASPGAQRRSEGTKGRSRNP